MNYRLYQLVNLITVICFLIVNTLTADNILTAGKSFDITPSLENGDQRWPNVAYGKGVYLVVWQEGEAMAGVNDTTIMAARVSADGKLLDPQGFAVCQAPHFQAYPMVTFDGEHFLVVWQDYRNKADWDVYADRIIPNPDGQANVLDKDGFPVATVQGNQIYPAVASDGKGTSFVVWSDVRPEFQPELYRLYGTSVRNGKPETQGGKEVAKTQYGLLRPYIVYINQGYGIIAVDGRPGWQPGQCYAVRITTEGSPQTWNIPKFMSWTYYICSDSTTGKAFVWSNCRGEHGSYQVWYLAGLVQEPVSGKGHAWMVSGLQDKFPPRNDLRGACTFDGKNFIGVVEQVPGLQLNKYISSNVKLVAIRFSSEDGKPIDAGGASVPNPEKTSDYRGVVHSNEYKEAMNKNLKAIVVAEEQGVSLRHPSIASSGNGKSLLVYSRRGGINKFKIYGVLLNE